MSDADHLSSESNESVEPAPQTESPSVPLDFKDRRAGLIGFGIVQLLMSGCVALFVVVMIATASQQPGGVRMLVPMFAVYMPIGIGLAVLGVGSILARRWARALILVLAWMWLFIGGATLVGMIVAVPVMLQMQNGNVGMPGSFEVAFLLGMFSMMGCLYVVLPGIFVAFYQSPHVKATCEQADPYERWTDRCPLPVLGLSLTLAFGTISFLPTAFMGGVVPFFGIILKGAPGIAMVLVCSVIWAWLAWGTYRLKMSAWWVTLLMMIGFGLSTVITFSVIDIMDFYEAMEMPQEQLDLIEKSPVIGLMPIIVGFSSLAFVIYLLWVRRYFVAAREASEAAMHDGLQA